MKENRTWRKIEFNDILSHRKKDRIIGLAFPAQNKGFGLKSTLEPAVLSVLPSGNNVEFSLDNIDFNDNDVKYYVCSVYISGFDEFKIWAEKHNRKKIIVGGYHPTTFPEEFIRYAEKIVQGPCDNFYDTIAQEGQIVNGILSFKNLPRYDLYDIKLNQQVIPDKKKEDRCGSVWTSQGCPMRCDFCCSPMMAPSLISKPISALKKEIAQIKKLSPKWLFIRDENFPLQKDWKNRLDLISETKAKIYLFASANLLNKEVLRFMKEKGVYMICLGLEDITVPYEKNKKLDEVVDLIKINKIYTYLSFIVDPLKIVGREAGEEFYQKLMHRFHELKPEMVCGNFLMPFRGTKIWDKYYQYVGPDDYKHYDSKTAFLIKNPIAREKMQFFMFWYQWQYYTSDFYNKNVRKFAVNDTLYQRFCELYDEYTPRYEKLWDVRP